MNHIASVATPCICRPTLAPECKLIFAQTPTKGLRPLKSPRAQYLMEFETLTPR
jgi:hypothetical protein